MAESHRSAASYRDPAGFVFQYGGVILRQVNEVYREHYDRLVGSGLYRSLVEAGYLVSHEEVDVSSVIDGAPRSACAAYRILKPERIPFVSYPYEWSFSQLKEAALLTLNIQRAALGFGMTLKDCSAYNIQFRGRQPVFIDTLSFETSREGEPWVAYRQFCQHFLAPLALMSLRDIRLSQMLRTHLDGIPLDLASRLLPWRTRLRLRYLIHIHLHALLQRAYADRRAAPAHTDRRRVSRAYLLWLIDHLQTAVGSLRWRPRGTAWADYYQNTTYSDRAWERKTEFVASALDRVKPSMVWDLGANTGHFSRLASERGIVTVAFDFDPACVEKNYLDAQARQDHKILPLVLDVTNPSPALGWMSRERESIFDRGPADLVLALALVHHLVFTGNVPLEDGAEFFCRIGHWLVVEFVPKDDPQAMRLQGAHPEGLHAYDRDHFEQAFQKFFDIEASEPLPDSRRVLFLMRRREG